MDKFEFALALNSLAMMMDEETFYRCEPKLKEIERGIMDLFKKIEEGDAK